jgi:hypothetical protein
MATLADPALGRIMTYNLVRLLEWDMEAPLVARLAANLPLAVPFRHGAGGVGRGGLGGVGVGPFDMGPSVPTSPDSGPSALGSTTSALPALPALRFFLEVDSVKSVEEPMWLSRLVFPGRAGFLSNSSTMPSSLAISPREFSRGSASVRFKALRA